MSDGQSDIYLSGGLSDGQSDIYPECFLEPPLLSLFVFFNYM